MALTTDASNGMCNKVRFTRFEAQLALYKAKRSKSRNRRECRYYKCDQCGWYHLTSQPDKMRR